MKNGNLKVTQKLLKVLTEEFGEDLVMGLWDDRLDPGGYIPFPIDSLNKDFLDIPGVPVSRLTEISGPEFSGKTSLLLALAAACQRMGGWVVWLEAERALNRRRARRVFHVRKDKMLVIKPPYTEKVFSMAETAVLAIRKIDKKNPILVGWDSVAATPVREQMIGRKKGNKHIDADPESDGQMAEQARPITRHLKRFISFIEKHNVAAVFINQIKSKPGVMYGSPESTPGGKAIKFHASLRIKVRRTAKDDKGVVCLAETQKNKLGECWRKAEFRISFAEGLLDAKKKRRADEDSDSE